jgi:hypothetical protein
MICRRDVWVAEGRREAREKGVFDIRSFEFRGREAASTQPNMKDLSKFLGW